MDDLRVPGGHPGGRTRTLDEAPLLKSALFLLYQELFQGAYLGASDKEKQRLWGEVLTTAADLERDEQDA